MADIHSFPHLPKRPAKKRAERPAAVARQWVCRVCEHDIGLATSELIETITAPVVKAGKIIGGQRRYICRHCNERGLTTVAP
jgi:hypothetical protein